MIPGKRNCVAQESGQSVEEERREHKGSCLLGLLPARGLARLGSHCHPHPAR